MGWEPPKEPPAQASSMLSVDELEGAAVNIEVAREALAQAERLLADTMATKAVFDRRAELLLPVYITLSLAAFGWAGSLHSAEGWPFVLAPMAAGACLLVGAGMFLRAMSSAGYGTFGSSPSLWLQNGVIDGDGSNLGAKIAIVVRYYYDRIAMSRDSNREKAKWVRRGIRVGLAAPVVLAVAAVAL